MPHITIEYSANLEGDLDMAGFCNHLRLAAIETGVFPLAGIRVRALRCDACSIADGDPQHGFMHILVRVGHGRDEETRKGAARQIFEAAKAGSAPVLARRPMGISLEMYEIDPDYSLKLNTIRDHLGAGS